MQRHNPRTIRTPITVGVFRYIESHNLPGESYGRTVERILDAAMRIGLEPSPPRPLKTDRAWSAEDDALILSGRSSIELAELLGRSSAAINQRRHRLRKGKT